MGRMEFRGPLRLVGARVVVRSYAPEDADELFRASRDPRVGQFLLHPPGADRPEFDRFVAMLLERQATGSELLFTTTLASSGRPIGMTRYIEIDRDAASVEVGGTWLDPRFWESPVNTESKLLLLRHAFEDEGVHRVWLRTDLRNERSQRAIARLGATREAVLREHLLLPSGHFRSSVYFGILEDEWPAVRDRLTTKLARPWNPPGGADA